jgi:Predicted AAA-ATPase/PD-(D/E)XK nuclease superfamily
MSKPLRVPTGIADFRMLREGGFEFIDKSHLISEFLRRDNHQVILVPRPRRFGKTINLTMLKWYFEKREENVWHLFEGLHIANAGETYREHFQKYPVIHLSFKGTKSDTWDECREKIASELVRMCEAHRPILEAFLRETHRERYLALVKGEAGDVAQQLSLSSLTQWLHEAHGIRPIVLIDEYDAPIHAGYAQGYYDKVVSFFRSFLEAGLKDNVHLERAFLTGILRVSKESIFSGLNNPGVYTLLEPEFNTCFGFTEAEVQALMEKAGLSEVMPGVRSFYDGYDFGGVEIYNPWSILEFLGRESRELRPYWVNTSQNDLTKRLLVKHAFNVEEDIQTLMMGGKIEKMLDDAIAFPDLENQVDTLWSILALTGYLKASVPAKYAHEYEVTPHELSIPNREVAHVYRQTFSAWLESGLRTQGGDVQKLTKSLLAGDVATFQEQLESLVLAIPSYHDVKGVDVEKFFHGLVIGLLATLEPEYEVRSNRESGNGRPDVLIKPRRSGTSSVVLELKTAKKSAKKTLKQALAEGHAQFAKNDYTADLRAAGLKNIHSLVIAFDGKKVVVEAAKKPTKKTAAKVTKKSSARKTKS